MNYSEIFSNSTSYEILGAEVWIDPKGATIGWTCEDGIFRVRRDYKFAYQAYCALMSINAKILIDE